MMAYRIKNTTNYEKNKLLPEILQKNLIKELLYELQYYSLK